MDNNRLERHFSAYSEWRNGLFKAINEFKTWLQSQELSDAHIDQRLEQVLAILRDDKLYIAFVAEFSRGKSELINAIFFAGFGQRVLPSSAGRTTMCPTELMYDPGNPPCLRLLPIETRRSGTTITEYKNFPEEWKVISLDMKAPDKVAEALQHIVEIKAVDKELAQAMGLHIAKDEADTGMHMTEDGKVEIPKWRHAIINFPHPLLEQGLVILDTPGLNALGAEPELTLNMLPSAHAIMFILAADTGVTKSDIEVWQEHIGNTKGGLNKGRLVVLNKIDGLWDELRDSEEVQREIDRQIRETAKHLGIEERNVYPVSAQKALLGKIKGDQKILDRSRIAALEDAFGKDMLPAKREIVSNNIRDEMTNIIKAVRALIGQRLKGVHEHMGELNSLSGKNSDVIEHMMKKVRIDKEHFEKSLQRFQATRSIFSQQTNILYSHLNLKNLDKVMAETKKNMDISLTTAGLKTSMQNFFNYAHTAMEEVTKQTNEIKELMDGVYKKFQEEHGLSNIKPNSFSIMKYLREIKRLEAKHEQFSNGLSLVMTEQTAVTRKFFESAVSKTRAIYATANRDADNWLKTIMSPMESQVREHQVQLRRRLESIKRIHQASDTLEGRLSELKQVQDGIREQEKAMETRIQRILSVINLTEDKSSAIPLEKSAS
ncbi:MAG TPA: dynamin family protein [Acidiferrobacterales bacterium]|nr:dynamin family protein [Acidiferrobacterales bacterium]